MLLMASAVSAMAQPRLVVNIVVSGMSAEDLQRYGHNFGAGGFRRMMQEGATFTECYADYAPTTTEAGLATIATGSLPSMHGVVSQYRYDRTSNKRVELCDAGVATRADLAGGDVVGSYGNARFVTQTLAEVFASSSSVARAMTIAHEPYSAMILAGRGGECYWMNKQGRWSTALCYGKELPAWVKSYNGDDMNRVFSTDVWYGRYTKKRYRNTHTTDIILHDKERKSTAGASSRRSMLWVERMLTMPSGNLALFEFAKRAVGSMMPLDAGGCKLLNICLDVPRKVVERYGPDSAEYEDMLYSLDVQLSDFITYVQAQVGSRDDLLFVLTSDHGTSPSQRDAANDASRFNSRQFEVIMNAFLSARYAQDDWVLGYADGSLYLNHDVIYRHKRSLVEVQNEVATFALQFRGIANALTATALKGGTLLHGTARLVQNGFHARHSGDVLLVLEPKHIALRSDCVSLSGSPYNYDRHVPLLVYGAGVAVQSVERRVGLESIAPTLAALCGLSRPQCSDAELLKEIKQ